MPITVKEVSEGSNLRWGDDGWEDTLVFVVNGLEGDTSFKKYQAAVAPGVPQRGFAHPYLPGIVARNCPGITMPKGHTFARVTINYAKPEDGDGSDVGEDPPGEGLAGISIRMGTVYERVPSNFSVNTDGTRGEKIELAWDPTLEVFNQETLASPPSSSDRNLRNTQTGQVDTFIARPTLIFRGKADRYPLSKSLSVGWTNSDDFVSLLNGRFDEVPNAMKEPDTWMLIRQTAESKDGERVDVEREVAFRADRWYGVAVFIDPATGRPPANTGGIPDPPQPGFEGNGIRVVRTAGQTSFIELLEFQSDA